MLPKNLILVRHGESEGNAAVSRAKNGDQSAYTAEFSQRDDAHYRLTRKGVMQAKAAGAWLAENVNFRFQRFAVSHFIRARETAAHLNLPDAEWRIEYYLSERSWGDLEKLSRQQQLERFPESMKTRSERPFGWRPPNGESYLQLCMRMDRVISTLVRECARDNVIAVCHGEVMWGMRLRLEKLTEDRFNELKLEEHPQNEIHNAQILHYTRIDPSTGEEGDRYEYFRSVCPWNLELSTNQWQPIVRKRYTNEELLSDLEQVPLLVPE